MEFMIKSTPKPTIDWFKDDAPLETDDRIKSDFDGQVATLHFTETELDDEGEYKCVARNEHGDVSAVTELLVNEAADKPEVKSKMRDIEAVPGDEVQFDVSVTGSPKPQITWYKGSEEIGDEGRYLYIEGEEEDVFSLSIEDICSEDAGTYKCVARNEAGEVTCEAELRVSDKPRDALDAAPIPVPESSDITNAEPIAAPVSSDVTEAEPIIAPVSGDVVESEPIISPEVSDATESQPISAPEFSDAGEAGPITVYEGGELRLSVGVRGSPQPRVDWFKNGRPVTESSRVEVKPRGVKFGLVVLDLIPQDSGSYECVASNKAGKASRKFEVNVQGKTRLYQRTIRETVVTASRVGYSGQGVSTPMRLKSRRWRPNVL